MKKINTLVLGMVLWSAITGGVWGEVCQSFLAGEFYPADKTALTEQIKQFLNKAGPSVIKGKLVAVIVPHAGYDYSGRVAAYAYKELLGRDIRRVVLIGASHRVPFAGIAVGDFDAWETLLGEVKIDRDFIKRLEEKNDQVRFVREAYQSQDNALEVQLPFLQAVLGQNYKLVPLLFGRFSYSDCRVLAGVLSELADDETVFVFSSDWSHYHDYSTAKKMDTEAVTAVCQGDVNRLAEILEKGSGEACGAPAVLTALLLAPALGANKTELLKYANSGDVTADKSRVVGYAAIAFAAEDTQLTAADKKELLKIARQTLARYLKDGTVPSFAPKSASLLERRGAFVTLNKSGALRGCIGYIQPLKPLYVAVQEMAVAAATRDYRFPPLSQTELKEIDIEISALSRLVKVAKIAEITVGRDGLYILKGEQSGLLLPQVPVENHWNKGMFLENLCYKAGLPQGAWQDKAVTIFRFSAEVFGEKQ